MPFQSEKQRRFLHANHPEIAKRWERDYANGGISNHFQRRPFKKGSYSRSYNPGAPGGVVQHGPIHRGGGNGGDGGGGHHAPVHTGPSPAELAAQKAAADAKAKADAEAKVKAEAALAHKEWIARKDKKKKKVNWAKKNWEDLKALSTIPLNVVKGAFGNPFNPKELTTATLTDAMKADLTEKAQAKGSLTGNIDYTDYNIPTKTFSGINKFMDPMDIANALTMGGTGFKTDEFGNIEFTGGKYDFNQSSNPVLGFIDQGGLMGASERLGGKIYDWTHKAAKGGVARKNYFHGGILDINESEEIIDDDGNEIELTDYNAAFDEPNGVKSLFRAKDGGRIGFQYGMSPGEAQARGIGAQHHGSTTSSQATQQTEREGEGGGTSGYVPGIGEVQPQAIQYDLEEEKKDYVWLPPKKLVAGQGTRPGKYVTLEEKAYWDRIDKVVKDIKEHPTLSKRVADKALNLIVDKAAAKIPFGSIIFMVAKLFGWKPTDVVKTDIAGNVLEDQVTGADLGFFDPDEYPELWGKGPDDDERDDDKGPIVDPVTLEVDEEYAQGEDGYPGFSLADMRAKQALNAQLQQKWAAEQEAYDQLYLGANSGGLANLFRVKN